MRVSVSRIILQGKFSACHTCIEIENFIINSKK